MKTFLGVGPGGDRGLVACGADESGDVAKNGRVVNGMGSDTDIVVASAKAYLSALNKMSAKSQRMNPQYGAEAQVL